MQQQEEEQEQELEYTPYKGEYGWSAGNVVVCIFLFVLAGFAEVGGGWLVWQTVRESKAWYMAVIGSLVLVGYGFIPTLQPLDNFGRIYAVYGGFFILLSYIWGWIVDDVKPDTGDWVGTGIALVGVLLALFWPGRSEDSSSDTA